MQLIKINPKRAFELVADQIEEGILGGRFRPGDKLPPERRMIEDLGVSRRTLREALRVLEQKGLIAIKLGPRGGAFVTKASAEQFTESLGLMIRLLKIGVQELSEFRLDLEARTAALAARRAEKSDLEKLRAVVALAAEVRTKPGAGFAEYRALDREFHLALAEAARNRMYASVLRMVHDNMVRYFEKDLHWHMERGPEILESMGEILKAVEARDEHASAELMKKHIAHFFSHVEADEAGTNRETT